jgi:hypothetical protein
MIELPTEVATGTCKTMGKLTQLLNNLVAYPKAIIYFNPAAINLIQSLLPLDIKGVIEGCTILLPGCDSSY